MEIKQQLVKSTDRTWEGVSACTSITFHETANTRVGAGAQNHANLQTNGNVRMASWNWQVDDKEAIQSFLDEVMCWHAGWAARDSIAVEICVNEDGDYDKALENAATLGVMLREKHGIGREAVKQHYDWSGKHCPARMRATGAWAEFVAATDPQGHTKAPVVGSDGKGAASTGGGRSVTVMAAEVIAGLHGNGHDTRRRSLGISTTLYSQVRAEVNRIASKPTIIVTRKTVSQMASEVIDGRHGQGHDNRRNSLGISASLYEQVRSEVNRRVSGTPVKSVSQMATEVLNGQHGNGHENRRRSLGISAALYEQVRRQVNRRA